jgi:hypothetical protein
VAYPVSDRANGLLGLLGPPILRQNPTIRAIQQAAASELLLLDAAMLQLLADCIPETSNDLRAFEEVLGLTVAPPISIAQRRTLVEAYLQRILSLGSGLEWEQKITALIGSSWHYAEHDPASPVVAGVNPPPNVLYVWLPYDGSGSTTASSVLKLIRSVTPANLAISVFYDGNFILDDSPLDGAGLA